MDALKVSFSAMGANLRLRRLFREDDGVEGCGVFHKKPDRQILRWMLPDLPRLRKHSAGHLRAPPVSGVPLDPASSWLLEYATTPDSVLSNAKSGGKGEYDVTGFSPSWVLEITIEGGALVKMRQVPFSDEVAEVGYTALSYPMKSAAVLATEDGFVPTPPPDDRPYTLDDRRTISKYFLQLYCSAARTKGNPDRTEYVWLDEYCLSDAHVEDHDEIASQRSEELGRLGDVFRDAAQVVAFCHANDCDHTGLRCIWGQRLFTIPEILHARTVLRLIRRRQGDKIVAHISERSGAVHREAMQTHAAHENKWHLHAIFQHTVNAGAVPWQVTIHALVVEAIRRDEAGSFHDHKYLGKALNGLLPRRARLKDLGNGGWNDLAWLLELNQGFYNAACLAAVCSISEDNSVAWLGKPIDPQAGNERLEPVVTAFPVANTSDPPLTIVAGETIGLRPKPLKRDAYGLYNNEEMVGLKRLAFWLSLLLALISTIITANIRTRRTGIALYYVTAILYCLVELMASTMYLDREGWVFLEDSLWGDELEAKLGEQDNNLCTLTDWGERQLVPRWEPPGPKRPSYRGKLVDLRSRVCIDVIVVSPPNVAMVPLAIHGSGVTCMLLQRPEDSEKEPNIVAQKVGMCNVPPYIFAQTIKSGTIYVGNPGLAAGKVEEDGDVQSCDCVLTCQFA
ncbi:hypothetical protein DFH06DRAFT_1304655 [Mycena polygramma]|nr:hypothetical protein DFH06DRAFT_1304655 [Mycena polygramma]